MPVCDTIWQISVKARHERDDARGRSMLAAAHRAGLAEVTAIRSTRLYQLRGVLEAPAVDRLARELFADPVIEAWTCADHMAWAGSPEDSPVVRVEVHLQPGVMDPVALSALDAARDQLQTVPGGQNMAIDEIRTAWRYEIAGLRNLRRVDELAWQVLANACMDTMYINGLGRHDPLPQRFPEAPTLPFDLRRVPLGDLSDDELAKLSRAGHLFLSVEEMRAVRDHFTTLKRDPTDLELETIAQTWSEHCVHKTLKAAVKYRGRGFGEDAGKVIEKTYDNLLKETIVRATKELNKQWCLSVFVDNAGVIEFDDTFGVAFKVETHNHPSAIEPYGGAATGAGGCIRDVLGCGLGAKPIANTDVFCVADPDFDDDQLPPGVLRPRRILRGIVSGVRDYGNRMGIPTVAGALYFDNRYLGNPLVFCGCVGLIPRNRIEKEPRKGDRIVLVGGRTGRDGIGGATFSSAELTDTHADEFAHAVQIGNAIEEKKVLDALLQARDYKGGCLYSALTDCGAGGLSSAVGEMGEKLGAEVDLETVPLKYSGLRYNEIWLSEAQERMVLAVPPKNLDALLAVFAAEEVETAVIGTFTGDGELCLRYNGTQVGRLDVRFLHDGIPKRKMTARWDGPKPNSMRPIKGTAAHVAVGDDLNRALLAKLADPNTASRESIFRQYDHEVQGGTVIKPAVGVGEGPSDAAVIRPLPRSPRGIAIGGGLCPQVADHDPYIMALRAVDEAIRNVICVGADPERIAILDNFCWGGCEDEEEMGALVRACQACYEAAIAYGTPFISGKDSLNNQFSLALEEAKRLDLPARITIPPTLLISAIGMVDDVAQCVTADLKRADDILVFVNQIGLKNRAKMHHAVAKLIRGGAVRACHDVSDGGLAVCLAEMCIGGRLGAKVDLGPIRPAPANGAESVLFDETLDGYVLEVAPGADLAEMGRTATCVKIGVVTAHARLTIASAESKHSVNLAVGDLAKAWRTPIGLD